MKSCRSGLFGVFLKKIISKYFEYFIKIFTKENYKSKVAPTGLLKSLLVMNNFFENFQEFHKNNFQYKNTSEG